MKTIRQIHMYVGCAFAPLLVFFIATGLLQTFDLHEARKDGSYSPPAWAAAAASVHMHQRLPPTDRRNAPSRIPMRALVAVTCVGLLTTVSLGVVLAWRMLHYRRGVLAAIALGTLIPLGVVFLQQLIR